MKLSELFQHKPIRYSLAGFVASILAYGLWQIGTPIVHEYQTSFVAREFKEYGVIGTYKKHFFSFWGKLDEMKALDQENQQLSMRVASLEKEIEIGRAARSENEAQAVTEKVSNELRKSAGSELARVLASIDYTVPQQLLPNQLYSLAVGYFRKQEYEQAAVILSRLIDLKEDTAYQKAETQLMCAISWYKLKHFKLAKRYLSQAKDRSEPSDSVYRTSLVWEALTAHAEGKNDEAQKLVLHVIARYPHSEEAAWLNRTSGDDGRASRLPASFDGREHPVLERKIDSMNGKSEKEADAKKSRPVGQNSKADDSRTKEEAHED